MCSSIEFTGSVVVSPLFAAEMDQNILLALWVGIIQMDFAGNKRRFYRCA